jgi:hypothetical protein
MSYEDDQFQPAKRSPSALKVQDLEKPVIGEYAGRSQGKYSPIYQIMVEEKEVVRILGNHDLQSQMENIPLGSVIKIEYAGSVETNSGRTLHKVNVGVKSKDPIIPPGVQTVSNEQLVPNEPVFPGGTNVRPLPSESVEQAFERAQKELENQQNLESVPTLDQFKQN